MTCIYFVRHAEPDYSVHDDMIRPLTAKGLLDAGRVTDFFSSVHVDAFYSSPYKRSADTIKGAAEMKGKEIRFVQDFRERKVSDCWIDDFNAFAKKQWADFSFKLPHGETLFETQTRNIGALSEILRNHDNETVVIGGHGTSISTIIHHYDPAFGYEDFKTIQSLMPFVILFIFEKERLIEYRFVSI